MPLVFLKTIKWTELTPHTPTAETDSTSSLPLALGDFSSGVSPQRFKNYLFWILKFKYLRSFVRNIQRDTLYLSLLNSRVHRINLK